MIDLGRNARDVGLVDGFQRAFWVVLSIASYPSGSLLCDLTNRPILRSTGSSGQLLGEFLTTLAQLGEFVFKLAHGKPSRQHGLQLIGQLGELYEWYTSCAPQEYTHTNAPTGFYEFTEGGMIFEEKLAQFAQ